MKNLSKAAVLLIFILSFVVCLVSQVLAEEWSFPAEISVKILDKDGKPFIENITVVITANILTDVTDYTGDGYKHNKYKLNVTGSTFNWKGQAYDVDIVAEKDGYHSTHVRVLPPPGVRGNEIKSNDVLIYLIPKGTPSKLEYVGGADIPDKADSKSGGKDCGWSFKKLWYFPIDEEKTVWMTLSLDEEGNHVYTMKEPGGFVLFPGYPKFESKSDELSVSLDWMTEAPESGYVQTIIPAKDKVKNKTEYSPCYYFRTPEGKYGKIRFPGLFSYYLQPDGSRNLEAGEVVEVGPTRPEYRERIEKEQRGY